MVCTLEKRQLQRLFSQLDDFVEDFNIGNAASGRQQNSVVNESTVDPDYTVNKIGCNLTANVNSLNVQILERLFNEKIDKERDNIVDTVEDWIQNAILLTNDNIFTPRTALAVRSKMLPLKGTLSV